MPFVNAEQTGFNVYYKSDPRAIYRLDNVLGGVDFGYAFNRFNELRVGYAGGYEDHALRLGQPEFSSFSGAIAAVQLRYVRDHTNEAIVPTSGHYIQLNFRWYNKMRVRLKPSRRWNSSPPTTVRSQRRVQSS